MQKARGTEIGAVAQGKKVSPTKVTVRCVSGRHPDFPSADQNSTAPSDMSQHAAPIAKGTGDAARKRGAY